MNKKSIFKDGANKNDRGITLIALVITIIVLLILAGVTVLMLSGENGILNRTAEAKFKTEVGQIKEELEIKKLVLLSDDLESLNNLSSLTIGDLDIDNKLKNKFDKKLTISKRSDDFVLCYDPKNVTNQERIWLEELNIFGTSFIEDVETSKTNNFDETFHWHDDTEIKGIRNLTAIHQDLKTKYPDAVFAYTYMLSADDLGLITFSSEEYRKIVEIDRDYTALYNYAKETGKETIEETDLTSEMLTIAENLKIELPITVSELYRNSVLFRTLRLGTITLNVFHEDEHVYISALPGVEESFDEAFEMVKDIKKSDFMKKEEVEKVLYLEKMTADESELGFGEAGLPLKVVGYKPNSYNITVPAYIVNSNNEVEAIKEIGSEAFAIDSSAMTTKPNKLDVIKMIQIEKSMEVEHYTELSLDVIKAYMSGVTGGSSDAIKDSYVEDTENVENNNNIKKEFIKESLGLMMNISKDNLEQYFLEEDDTMYAMLTFNEDGSPSNVYKVKDENGDLIDIEYVQYIGNITLSEGIIDIGERAFAGQMIYSMYFPTTMRDATNAFQDINTIGVVKTKLTREKLENVDGFASYGPFGLSGNYWDEIFEIIEE